MLLPKFPWIWVPKKHLVKRYLVSEMCEHMPFLAHRQRTSTLICCGRVVIPVCWAVEVWVCAIALPLSTECKSSFENYLLTEGDPKQKMSIFAEQRWRTTTKCYLYPSSELGKKLHATMTHHIESHVCPAHPSKSRYRNVESFRTLSSIQSGMLPCSG